jgi:hypothetical protein
VHRLLIADALIDMIMELGITFYEKFPTHHSPLGRLKARTTLLLVIGKNLSRVLLLNKVSRPKYTIAIREVGLTVVKSML